MQTYCELPNKPTKGFTLIEIIIVITIIGIISTIVLSSLNSARDKSHTALAQRELTEIRSAMEVLYSDTGTYPNGANSYCRSSLPANNEIDLSTDAAGLLANGGGFAGWGGPYISDIEDPWGNPYYLDEDYQCMASTTGCGGIDDVSTDSSVIVSCGPNGALSGGSCDYDDDNIVVRLCDPNS